MNWSRWWETHLFNRLIKIYLIMLTVFPFPSEFEAIPRNIHISWNAKISNNSISACVIDSRDFLPVWFDSRSSSNRVRLRIYFCCINWENKHVLIVVRPICVDYMFQFVCPDHRIFILDKKHRRWRSAGYFASEGQQPDCQRHNKGISLSHLSQSFTQITHPLPRRSISGSVCLI